jgi:hypothetical protein
MKAKTAALVLAALACIGVSTSAATVFKISVEGQADVLSATAPVERGSVILARRLSDGQLTAIPAELVRSVSTVPRTEIRKMTSLTTAASGSTIVLGRAATTLATRKTATTTSLNRTTPATSKSAATLANGATTVFLGPTGGRAATTLSGVSGDTLVVSAAGQAGTTMTSANSLPTSIEAQVFRGDLPRLTPRAGELTVGNALSLGTNAASSAAAAAPVAVGPNGFPIFANVTVPALATIGPNGFITSVPATAVTTTASTIPIGTNGFPDTNAQPTAQTGLTIGGAATVPVTQTSTASTGTASRAAAGSLSTAPTAASSASAPSAGATASSPK